MSESDSLYWSWRFRGNPLNKMLHCGLKKGAEEDHPDVRYFTFVVLHEIAHAFKKHRSPLYDNLSKEEASAQEKEADDLAFLWFNDHVRARNNPYLHPLTYEEIDAAKEKNQKVMNELYAGT